MTRDVSVIGPLNIDLLINGDGPQNWESIPTWDGPGEIEMTAAGSVGYTVSDLSKLGLNALVSSCVPDDAMGAFIVESLKRDGVDTGGINVIPDQKAGIGVYMLLFGSSKRPLVYRMPTHQPWPQKYAPEDLEELFNCRLIHCGGYLHFRDVWHGVTVEIFKEAKKRSLLTSLDPQFPLFPLELPWMAELQDLLPYIDIFFCDETEARKITSLTDLDDCARMITDAGPETVIIKKGLEGSSIYCGGNFYQQEAVKLGELVDSIGAGDAFDAGFIYGTLQGWKIEKTALFASVAAGFTVTGVGGSNTFPKLDDIMQKLNS